MAKNSHKFVWLIVITRCVADSMWCMLSFYLFLSLPFPLALSLSPHSLPSGHPRASVSAFVRKRSRFVRFVNISRVRINLCSWSVWTRTTNRNERKWVITVDGNDPIFRWAKWRTKHSIAYAWLICVSSSPLHVHITKRSKYAATEDKNHRPGRAQSTCFFSRIRWKLDDTLSKQESLHMLRV